MLNKEDLQKKWRDQLKKAEEREKLYSKPEMRGTPAAKAHYRKIGAILFILAIIVTCANYLIAVEANRIYYYLIAMSIFLLPFSLWMMLFGGLPKWFRRFHDYLERRKK